jgi:hypothetical protein
VGDGCRASAGVNAPVCFRKTNIQNWEYHRKPVSGAISQVTDFHLNIPLAGQIGRPRRKYRHHRCDRAATTVNMFWAAPAKSGMLQPLFRIREPAGK